MSGLEIDAVAAVAAAVVVLIWLTFVVWRIVERLMAASREERGPVSDRGPRTERGLREAMADPSGPR